MEKKNIVDKVNEIAIRDNKSIEKACDDLNIHKDTYYTYKKALKESHLYDKDSNILKMQQLESKPDEKESKKIEYERVCISITKDNLAFLRDYCERHKMGVSTKGAELLNNAIYKMRKDLESKD